MIGNNFFKINPNYYSNICGTTGLLMFYVKDILEYAGVIIDKKVYPNKVFNAYTFCYNICDQIEVRLKRLLERFYDLN